MCSPLLSKIILRSEAPEESIMLKTTYINWMFLTGTAQYPPSHHFNILSLFHTTMSFSDPYGFDITDQSHIKHAIDSLPPNMNGPPPISIEDIKERFAILYKATVTRTSTHSLLLFQGTYLPLLVKLWKAANESAEPFADIVISPLTHKYLSVDEAIRKINEEVPPEYRLAKPYATVSVRNRPAQMDKAEWTLMKNGDTDALLKRWGSQELQVLEDFRRKKLFEGVLLFTYQQNFI